MTTKPTPPAKGAKPAAAFPTPSKDEVIAARKEGIAHAITESTSVAYKTGADQGYGDNDSDAEAPAPRHAGSKEVFQLLHMLEMSPDALKAILDGTPPTPPPQSIALTDGQIVGLLEAERSGKNRTDIVKVLCERLKIKHPSEVTAAGPAYTNDITRL